LSPGITISTPLGNVQIPVTSVGAGSISEIVE